MKRLIIGIATCLTISACGSSPEVRLNETCNTVMSAPQVRADILEANITVADYCTCASAALLALPESEGATAIGALETMEQLMGEHGGSAEAAFEALSESARADDATPDIIATYEAMDELGDTLDDILDGIKDAGGVCPA